jgi:hypothetical protein
MSRVAGAQKRLAAPVEGLAAAAILLALVAFALIRVQAVDVPWHLATARLAQATGHWPTRNTFSFTFPDFPLYQQYPAFQAVVYAIFERWSWSGLSVFACAGWAVVFLAFVRWAGPWAAARARPLLWMLGLHALQRRMILRPDLFSMLALAALLLALDRYTRRRRWVAALPIPLVHLFWVNSHQLFPLSLLIQGLFLLHLALARWGRGAVDRSDAAVPIAPVAVALAASIVLCLATPIGLAILDVMRHTAGSLAGFRDQVSEFSFIWQTPLELRLSLLTGVPALWALWRCRRRWSPFEVGLWLLSLALVLSAMRGLMFFGIVSVAVAQRSLRRLEAAGEPVLPGVRPALKQALAVASGLVTLLLAANVVVHRWVHPPLALGGTQPGVGRSVGGWADGAIAFLRANPPPGRMMNMAWPSGNALIWGLPEQPVFVDPRFESYPHSFLRAVADGYDNDARLAALIDLYHPTWIFAEHFRPAIRARVTTLLGRGWAPVYVDADDLILVREVPETTAYRAAHLVDLARAEPGELLPGPPFLRAQQRGRFALLLQALGQPRRAAAQREAASREAGPAGLDMFDHP